MVATTRLTFLVRVRPVLIISSAPRVLGAVVFTVVVGEHELAFAGGNKALTEIFFHHEPVRHTKLTGKFRVEVGAVGVADAAYRLQKTTREDERIKTK